MSRASLVLHESQSLSTLCCMLSMYLSFFSIHALSSILVPYLPIILHNHGLSPTVIGFLLGLHEGVGILGPFLVAQWSDRSKNPRRVLLLCTVLLMAACIPLTLAPTLLGIVLAISVVAFFWRSMFPVQDSMAMLFLGGDTWKYTKLRASGTLGFVCFSLFFQFTPFLHTTDNRSLLIWLLIGGVVFSCSLLFIPKAAPLEKVSRKRILWPFSKSALGHQVFSRSLILGIVVIGLNRFSMSVVSSFFSLYVTEDLGRGDSLSLLMALGAASELFFMLIAGRLLHRGIDPMRLITISSIGLCLRLAIYALFPSLGGAVLGQLFHSIVFGFLHPAAVVFVYRHMALEHSATGMALYTSFGVGLPMVLGTLLSGFFIELIGFRNLFGLFIVFALLSLFLSYLYRKELADH